jgi:hypothetical protein
MDYVTNLNSGIVVERTAFEKLKNEDLGAGLAKIYSENKPVVIVRSAQAFFNRENLIKVIDSNDQTALPIILEKLGIEFTDEFKVVITSFARIKAQILESLQLSPASNVYTFADVPKNWSIDQLKITDRNIYRKNNSNYSIGHKTLERIWKYASNIWIGNTRGPEFTVSAAGYSSRNVSVQTDTVYVGCQSIERFELEAVAQKLGWEFPEKVYPYA